MNKIRIGCIGLGMIANAIHLPQVAQSLDICLTAICDIDEEKLRETGDKYGIDEAHRFTEYSELIACHDVDAVDICTPNDCHFQIAMTAVKLGKPYSLEKPVTLTAEQADALADETKKAKLKSMVCFSYRFKSAARYAHDLIAQGLLGEIYHVNMQYFQDWGLPNAKCPLVWRFVKERTGSGALGDLGSHALDLVRFVTGREYEKVVSHAETFIKERQLLDGSGNIGICDVDDFCNCLARMEGGISASFQITRFGYGRGNYQRMEIYGSKGSLIYKLDEKQEEDELEVCIGQPTGETHTFTKIPIHGKYHSIQMQSFADILNGHEDGMAATIEDGRINQHVVDAVIQSFEQNKWVTITQANTGGKQYEWHLCDCLE